MAQVINTNVMSLNAQRNLSTSGTSLATSLQRLSSGLRINSAKDDDAGLAFSDRFTTHIGGLYLAVRTANDGISLAQTAESALGELTSNLQRIRELAVQSANSTNSASDRQALNQEVEQRVAEINRIATQTAFNGLKVLDGSFGTSQFQVGANSGETITVNLSQGVRADQIGQIATAAGTAVTANALTDAGLSIQVGSSAAVDVGASVAGTAAGQQADSAYAKAIAINQAGVPGLTATAVNTVTGAFTTTSAVAGDTYGLEINGVDIYAAGYDLENAALTGSDVAAQINLFSNQTGVTASFAGGNMTLTSVDGRNITAEETLGGAATGGIANTIAGNGAAVVSRGTVSLTASENITMTGAFADIGHSASITKDPSMTVGTINVNTVADSNDAMKIIDSALTTVSNVRSSLGAIQNRFESTINNLQTVSENLSASRSRILDADFAAETANLTRAQILQQAGTAILAQANSVPQNVLSLLR